MRRTTRALLIFFPAIFISLLTISCESPQKAMEQKNMDFIRRVTGEVINSHDVNKFDEILSHDYIRHCQSMPPGQQEIRGVKSMKAFIADFLTAVPDYHEEIELMLADGDKVAYITRGTGTQTGPMGSLPATGKRFEIVNIAIHRLENEKIAETWISWDNVAMLSQLGLVPVDEPADTKEIPRQKKIKKAPRE